MGHAGILVLPKICRTDDSHLVGHRDKFGHMDSKIWNRGYVSTSIKPKIAGQTTDIWQDIGTNLDIWQDIGTNLDIWIAKKWNMGHVRNSILPKFCRTDDSHVIGHRDIFWQMFRKKNNIKHGTCWHLNSTHDRT